MPVHTTSTASSTRWWATTDEGRGLFVTTYSPRKDPRRGTYPSSAWWNADVGMNVNTWMDCFGERFFYVLANRERTTGYASGVADLDCWTPSQVNAVTAGQRHHRQRHGRGRAGVQHRLRLDRRQALRHRPFSTTRAPTFNPSASTLKPARVEAVGDDLDDDASFGSGNCDIDALGNRYFMFAGGKPKVWNTGTATQP